MEKTEVGKLIFGDKYYSVTDLRYNQKIGIMLSRDQFYDFLNTKDQMIDEHHEYMEKLPLKSFNSKNIFYVNGLYLMNSHNEYLRILISDYELNQSFLFTRNSEDILTSRLFSEVEGTLQIENVPTTHKRIVEIHNSETLSDKNDIIVKNMMNAMHFIIVEKPEFNKENLLKLYNLLSSNCLPNELEIKDGEFYRDDKVFIGDFEGAPCDVINDCMDSLFTFANDRNYIEKYKDYLPHICHYYILYVHPYFDYNGRTARMVSFWLSYINEMIDAPFFLSEAINETKQDYYNAITDTRISNNDLTYFLGYVLETSIKYSFIYKNLEEIRNELSKTGDTLTSTEWVYVKKILVHNPENYFNYKLFLKYIGATMSKQGASKILNNLTDYDILEKSKNKKGETIYKLNQDLIVYKYNA
ncbi:MAG: Fic family protein [Ruminococcaceae bacterium]|nr:Fic family protein [Oscillospiraceae bacterium]